MTDPIERIVARALDKAGIAYDREPREHPLDFRLQDGTLIEVKQFWSERAIRQLAGRENVILIQGRAAAEGFARLLCKSQPNAAGAGRSSEEP